VILAQEEEIQLKDLLQKNSLLVVSSPVQYTLREVETRHIRDVLSDTEGNYSHAAKMLGISRVTLYNKVKKYGINVKE
jgi:transcriptional regulator of acetoin/glycerol metabolism